MHLLKKLTAWTIGLSVFLLRCSVRARFHNDPRPSLRRRGVSFGYAGLHAHQINCIITAERGCVAMASRSGDGDMVVPTLRLCGFGVIRGSGGRTRRAGVVKGGARALQQIIQETRRGKAATITVDGPSGPRSKVKPGIGMLALKAECLILPTFAVPRRRIIAKSSWDRVQLPLPFSTLDVYFGEPIGAREGETAQDIAARVEDSLTSLEKLYDPSEAIHQYSATQISDPRLHQDERVAA